MSVFKKQELVKTYPAYNVFRREPHSIGVYVGENHKRYDGVTEITANEVLILKTDNSKSHLNTYYAQSVASYAIENNDCPITAIERAKARGHHLTWISQRAAVLTAHKRDAIDVIEVEVGMLVRFEGVVATIQPDHNGNLKFSPVTTGE